jgi:hypothetical protein
MHSLVCWSHNAMFLQTTGSSTAHFADRTTIQSATMRIKWCNQSGCAWPIKYDTERWFAWPIKCSVSRFWTKTSSVCNIRNTLWPSQDDTKTKQIPKGKTSSCSIVVSRCTWTRKWWRQYSSCWYQFWFWRYLPCSLKYISERACIFYFLQSVQFEFRTSFICCSVKLIPMISRMQNILSESAFPWGIHSKVWQQPQQLSIFGHY